MTTWIKTKIFWVNNTLSWKEPRYNRSLLVTTRKQLLFFKNSSHFGDTLWVLTALWHFSWVYFHDFYSMIGQPLPAEALHILLSGLGHWLNWLMVLAILHQGVHRFNCELEVCNKDSWLCRLKICPAFISTHLYNFSAEKPALYDVTKLTRSSLNHLLVQWFILVFVPFQTSAYQFLQKGENPGCFY